MNDDARQTWGCLALGLLLLLLVATCSLSNIEKDVHAMREKLAPSESEK